MTNRLLKMYPFKVVLTTFLCFVFILGLASQNHAIQLFTDGHSTSSEILITEQHDLEASDISNIAVQTANEITVLSCDKNDCTNHSLLDDCCNSICHSILLTPVFALPGNQTGNHKLSYVKYLTDRTVAPALSPPRV